MNLLFNGFGTPSVEGMVAAVSAGSDTGMTFWIRDNYGEDRIRNSDKLRVIDHQAATIVDISKLPPVADGITWSDPVLDLYGSLKSTVLKMMDRLDRYGPAIGYSGREAIYRKQFLYWHAFLKEYEIEAFVTSNIPHEISDFVLAELCEVLNIHTLCFYQWTPDIVLPLRNYRELSDQSATRQQGLSAADQSIVDRVADRVVAEQLGGTTAKPFYMVAANIKRQTRKRESHWLTRTRKKVIGNWGKLLSLESLRYGLYLTVGKRWLQPARDRSYTESYARLADKSPDLGAPYVYLALHYQPEATTSPLGGPFVEQYLMVDVLLAAFPPEVSVYVKEHPNQRMIGRGKHYLDLFPASSRVTFVSTDHSSAELQANALAVATVSGTVGFESIWKGRPVLLFGSTYYGGGPGVHTIQSISDARQAAAEILSAKGEDGVVGPREFLSNLLERVIPANIDTYYHDNSVEGLAPEHNVRILRNEILARIPAPASAPK